MNYVNYVSFFDVKCHIKATYILFYITSSHIKLCALPRWLPYKLNHNNVNVRWFWNWKKKKIFITVLIIQHTYMPLTNQLISYCKYLGNYQSYFYSKNRKREISVNKATLFSLWINRLKSSWFLDEQLCY